MLKFLRRKEIAKAIFWALVILILPAFVLWGTGSLSGSKDREGPRFAGMIDKKKVSFDELYEAITATRSLLVLNYFNQPQALEMLLRDKPLLGKLGWGRLIMLKEAKRYRIKIHDEDVVAFIRSHPLFLRGGAFDEKLYGYVLKYNMGLEPRAFEEIIRSNLEVQRLNDSLTKDITASDEEVLSEYKQELSALKEPKVLDEEKFKKEKDEFSKKVLGMKKTKFLEDWLRRLEAQAKLNIDFKDMDKYYK